MTLGREIPWQPYRESIGATLARNGVIAAVVGAALAMGMGGWRHWPLGVAMALWPSFGGHWVEVGFLNGVRPRISAVRAVQVLARVGVWFVAGVVIWWAMLGTAMVAGASGAGRWPAWWAGGVGFVGIELVAHLGLWGRGRGNFYNGKG